MTTPEKPARGETPRTDAVGKKYIHVTSAAFTEAQANARTLERSRDELAARLAEKERELVTANEQRGWSEHEAARGETLACFAEVTELMRLGMHKAADDVRQSNWPVLERELAAATLRAEGDAKDAERYRWLRDAPDVDSIISMAIPQKRWDSTIDAARARQEKP